MKPKGLTRWYSKELRSIWTWNDASRPGRPAGGEAQGLRAVLEALS